MMARLFDAVFRLQASPLQFFQLLFAERGRRPQAGALTGTYVACLDCGREFPTMARDEGDHFPVGTRQYRAALAPTSCLSTGEILESDCGWGSPTGPSAAAAFALRAEVSLRFPPE